MRRHTALLLSITASLAILLVSTAALAQAAPDASVTQAGLLSAKDLAWIGFASSVAAFLAPFFDPANSDTPFDWAPSKRMGVFTLLGAITGILHLMNAQTPWTTSLLVGATTVLIPAIGHLVPANALARASRKAAVAAGAAVAVVLFAGCTPAQGAADLKLGECIGETAMIDILAGETDQQVADDVIAKCQGATQAAVNTILPDVHQKAAAHKAVAK